MEIRMKRDSLSLRRAMPQFEYICADSPEEAACCWREAEREGKIPLWYAGGYQLLDQIDIYEKEYTLIDIKKLCSFVRLDSDRLYIGAGATLTQIKDSGIFPLMGDVVGEIADHTARCRITLGGSVYGDGRREAALPLLLCGAEVRTFKEGYRDERFTGKRLNHGELALMFAIERKYLSLPFIRIRQAGQQEEGFLSAAALRSQEGVRIAIAGEPGPPVRLKEVEDIFESGLTDKETAKLCIGRLKEDILVGGQDMGRRKQLLQNTFERIGRWNQGEEI